MARKKLAIDLDASVTNIYMLGSGLVLSEPTVASTDTNEKQLSVKSVGLEASKLIGKNSKNTRIVFPVFEGEIVNERVASGLLQEFLNKIEVKTGLFSSNVALFSVPCGSTSKNIEKYRKIAHNCGISKVYFAEAPVLSALGQQLPLTDSTPCFVIDMAGGTTNIAAVSLDGVIAGLSVNFGYNKINTDIIDYISENFNIQIGLLTADKIRKEICSLEEGDALPMVINGRNIDTGRPISISLKACDILTPTKKYFDKIAEIAIDLLKKLPPEVSAEVRRSGIYVSGGGSAVYGLEKYYTDKFGITINVANNGLLSVALGAGVALGNTDLLKKISILSK